MTPFLDLGLIALAFVFYCLPGIIGLSRGVTSPDLLWFLNLLLGWPAILSRDNVFTAGRLTFLDPLIDLTVLGWIVLLIWAVAGQTKAADAYYRRIADQP